MSVTVLMCDTKMCCFSCFEGVVYPHQHSVFFFLLKVKAFCDVDANKIQKNFYTYEESKVRSGFVVNCSLTTELSGL